MKHTIRRQLSVAIENQPGRLAAICRLMADHGINIRDITIVDNVEQGMIRFIPSDSPTCKDLLSQHGFHVVEADVLVLLMKDTPGRLATVSKALGEAHVNIDYAYGSEDPAKAHLRLVLKVSNIQKATATLGPLFED